jgi:hypothetical protein
MGRHEVSVYVTVYPISVPVRVNAILPSVRHDHTRHIRSFVIPAFMSA